MPKNWGNIFTINISPANTKELNNKIDIFIILISGSLITVDIKRTTTARPITLIIESSGFPKISKPIHSI